jgi:hypothetical protein
LPLKKAAPFFIFDLSGDSVVFDNQIHNLSRQGKTTMKKIDEMLAEAQSRRSWGEIVITLKDGKPILLKQTIQERVEDYPANDNRN